MKVKKDSEKADFKTQHSKNKDHGSGPIISWQIDGETMETVTDFIFSGSKITGDGDWSQKLRLSLFGRNAMTNLDEILQSRDITLPTRVHLVKAMVFPVVMYKCDNWTKKKAERQRTDTFELWCWRRVLRVPWTARRSNQSILKEINPEYSLEGLMLKLKLQYFGHLMRSADSLEKTLSAGKDWGQKEKGTSEDEMIGWHHWLIQHEFEKVLGDGKGQGSLACCSPWGCKSQTGPNDWTTKNTHLHILLHLLSHV